jgi:eukaryotic-like serine/threonine-protein kinase
MMGEGTPHPLTDLPAGTRIGPYEIASAIARGGAGVVYRARHATLGDVALKVLYPHLAADESFIKRFEREARSMAALQHPNIVRVLNADTNAGQPYLAMQFASNGTLRDLLARTNGNQLSIKQALGVARQVALGLHHAHEHGVIHRDIKPGNILFDADWRVMIADFGIAHVVSDARITQTKASLGTPEYMSPEQGKGELVDARSDVYSLGIVLYEMLAGRPPFTSDNHMATLFRHSRETPTQLTRYRPETPAAVRTVVMRALAKRPRDRFQSAAEFADAIGRALEGRTVSRFGVRHAFAAAGGLALLSFGAAGAILLLSRQAQPEQALRAATGTPPALAAKAAATASPLPLATATLAPSATALPPPSATPLSPPTPVPAGQSETPTPEATATAVPIEQTATPQAPGTATAATTAPAAPANPRASATPRVLADARVKDALGLAVAAVRAERWGRPPQWQNADPNICAYINSAETVGGAPLWRFNARVRLINKSREQIRLAAGSVLLQGANGYTMRACGPAAVQIEPLSETVVTFSAFFEGDRLAPGKVTVLTAQKSICFAPVRAPTDFNTDTLDFGAVACQ